MGDVTTGGRTRWPLITAAVAFVAVYAAVVAAYALDTGDDTGPDTRTPPTNGVLVYLDLDSVSGDTYSIDARVSVYAGPDLVDVAGDLRRDMTVEVSPAASSGSVTFARGTSPASSPVSLYADGDIRTWPFDTYRVDALQVRAYDDTGSGRVSVPTRVVVSDSMASWRTHATGPESVSTRSTVSLRVSRTGTTVAFGLAMCAVLVVLPVCTLSVAVLTLRRRKQFLPPIVTWFAVMLFAVLPLRNLFPGSPPIGSWVDYTVVLWVVIGLTTALAVYVIAWWRQAP